MTGHWTSFLSFIAMDAKDGEGCKLKMAGKRFRVWTWCITKIPKIVIQIAYPSKIHLIFSFWFIENVVAFQSTAKFCVSTSYDLKTTVAGAPLSPLRLKLNSILKCNSWLTEFHSSVVGKIRPTQTKSEWRGTFPNQKGSSWWTGWLLVASERRQSFLFIFYIPPWK